ncbi:MAG TPA: ABC transporter ATP-binding protein [Actinomycetota bacterium]|nr:ABC transporter ATP-binding protein [Actinomycetota bacterium]
MSSAPAIELEAAGVGTPLLEVQDLVVRYPVRRGIVGALRRLPRRSVRAVDGISFSVRSGEMLALVGESGCGKTSTAQTILRLVDPEAGAIRLDGAEITGLPQRRLQAIRRRVQMIYQDPYESLDPRFRVRQAIEEPMLIHGVGGDRHGRERRVLEALARVELTPPEMYLERYPHELSGGQRQRVAIAASLVLEPALLVADEPVSMLDVSVRAGILRLLDDLRRAGSLGILMITHDLSTAAHFADRIAVMYLGRIVEVGPAREVVRRPQHPYTKALLSVVPKRDPRERGTPQILTGEPPDPVDVPSGCRFHPRCPVAEPRCRTIDPELRLAGSGGHRAACVLVGES